MRCVICDHSNSAPSFYNQEPHQPHKARKFYDTDRGPVCDFCYRESGLVKKEFEDTISFEEIEDEP